MGSIIMIFALALPVLASDSLYEEERKQFYSRVLHETSLPTECANAVVDFLLIDPSGPSPSYSDLDIVNISDYPSGLINVEAVTETSPAGCTEKVVECVKFFLDGEEVRKERFKPFTLYGNVRGGPIHASTPPIGTFTLKACTYSDNECSLDEMGCYEQQVTFTEDSVPTQTPVCDSVNEVTGFELVNTENPYRPVISPFTPVIELSDYSSCMLNIFATVSTNSCGDAPVGCVKLTLGDHGRKEQLPPYALYGNTGRFIRSGTPPLGASTVRACTYTDSDCREGESGCLEVDIFVNDCVNMSM